MIFRKALARNKDERGAILVEALFALPVMVVAMLLHLELIRRVHLMILVHHGAFLYARYRGMGVDVVESRRAVARLFERAYGDGGRKVFRRLNITEQNTGSRLIGKVHYRYASFIRVPYSRNRTKHHFEVTGECRF